MERRLLGTTTLVAAGRRGAALGTAAASRGKPCDRGDHERTCRRTPLVNFRTLHAEWRRSPPAVRKKVEEGRALAGPVAKNLTGGIDARLLERLGGAAGDLLLLGRREEGRPGHRSAACFLGSFPFS
jgi:hypothetical protein